MDNQKIISTLKHYLQKPGFMDLVSVDAETWSVDFKRNISMIRSWKTEHEKEYSHFKADIMHSSYGDYSAYEKIFKLAATCIPPTVMQNISYILTGKKTEPVNPELDEFISSLANIEGYLEFNKVEMECDLNIAIEDIHLDIVPEPRNERKFLYERIPCALEFFYNLPWEWQSAMRTLNPRARDMDLAIMSRSLYLKICLTQNEIMKSIEKIGKKRDSFIMCLFYFIVYDHGLKIAYNALLRSLEREQNLGIFNKTVIPTLKLLVSTSIENGHDSKAAWYKEIKASNTNTKLRNEIFLVVKNTKGISGRPRTSTNIKTLDSLLVGNVRSVKNLIDDFRYERYRPVDLAYLFIILRSAGLTKEHYYTVFHHAMEEYEGRKYSLRNPQEVFNNFPMDKEILEKRGTAHQKHVAKEIEDWVDRFSQLRKSA